jgi:hypothetical protein
MKDIFISYSSDDRAYVEPIVNVLREQGLNVFFDQDLQLGEAWFMKIDKYLRQSRVTVIFITPSSVNSPWVQQEVASAFQHMVNDKSRHIISVLMRRVDPQLIHSFLLNFNVLDRNDADETEPEVRREIGLKLGGVIRDLIPGIGRPHTPLPVVVFAMTKAEATALFRGSVAATDPAKFAAIVQELAARNHSAEQLLELYAETRDDWRSPLCQTNNGGVASMRETVEDVVDRINRMVLSGEATGDILIPEYFSEAVTNPDFKERNYTYKELSERGCVLIIDSLTLFHPDLRTILNESGLVHQSKIVPIVAPPPYYRSPETLDNLLEDVMKMMLGRPFFRYDDELDILCEFGVNHPRALRRWLFSVLPMAAEAINTQKPRGDTRRMFRELSDEPRRPRDGAP